MTPDLDENMYPDPVLHTPIEQFMHKTTKELSELRSEIDRINRINTDLQKQLDTHKDKFNATSSVLRNLNQMLDIIFRHVQLPR